MPEFIPFTTDLDDVNWLLRHAPKIREVFVKQEDDKDEFIVKIHCDGNIQKMVEEATS